ncbi:MAG: hypothetical protein IIY69_05255, partial [Clostridia bacterium]|nr:hypothetical protein [Clostridia bacterium]
NESVSCIRTGNTIKVSGGVSGDTPVYAAMYDEHGRIISLKMLRSPGAIDAGGAYKVKLIWMNGESLTPKGEAAEFELK